MMTITFVLIATTSNRTAASLSLLIEVLQCGVKNNEQREEVKTMGFRQSQLCPTCMDAQVTQDNYTTYDMFSLSLCQPLYSYSFTMLNLTHPVTSLFAEHNSIEISLSLSATAVIHVCEV